jgi:hypothetical protein
VSLFSSNAFTIHPILHRREPPSSTNKVNFTCCTILAVFVQLKVQTEHEFRKYHSISHHGIPDNRKLFVSVLFLNAGISIFAASFKPGKFYCSQWITP